MSFARLQHVAAVARTQSFTRASEELRISQPALSRSVSGIEAHYGIKIFQRGRLGVTLTPAGAQVMAEIDSLLRSCNDLDQNLQLHGRARVGRVTFGMSPQLSSLLLTSIAAEVFHQDAQIQLKAMVRSAPDLLQALIEDEIEFFIGLDSRLEAHPEVEVTPIGEANVTFIVRAGHELAGRGPVTLAEVQAFPFVSAVDTTQSGARGRTAATFVCDSYHVMRDIVLTTDFVFACVRDFVGLELETGRMCELKVADYPLKPRQAVMVRRRRRSLSPLAKKIIAVAQKRFDEQFSLSVR